MSILYLRSDLSDISLGTNNSNKLGTTVAWRARSLTETPGTGVNVTATVASITGTTIPGSNSSAGPETGSPTNEWISPPLAAAITISGTLTFRICANQSNAMANAYPAVIVERVSNTGAVLSTVVDSQGSTELGTSNARVTWTATPTSTVFAKGDRIRIRYYFANNTTNAMASGYTLTLTYDGTNANTGDSNVDFAETLAFMSPPAPTGTFNDVTSSFNTSGVYDIATDGSLWVAVGANGKLATASQATGPWTQRSPGITSTFSAIAYGNGTWVATSAVGASLWTATDPTGAFTLRFTSGVINDVHYNNGLWVGCGRYTAAGAIFTAVDPTTTWTLNETSLATDSSFNSVYYGNGLWVAVGSVGEIWTATDPAGTWTSRTSPTSNDFYAVAYGNGRWIITSLAGLAYWSTNPVAGPWTTITLPSSGIQYDVVYVPGYGSGVWLLSSGIDLLYSITGTSFSLVTTPSKTNLWNILGIAGTSSELVIVGQLGGLAVANSAPTSVYPTATASDVADQGASVTELTAWTSRGNG